MKILFLDWPCFNREDTVKALKNMGHEVILFFHKEYNELKSEDFLKEFKKTVSGNRPEVVFSYNYFPIMAIACKDENIPYISFVYDSPYVYIYSYTLAFPTNHVFLFDSGWVNEFNAGGLMNVHYMVLPGNTNKIKELSGKKHDRARTKCDLSFVGTLYNEQHNFYERLEEKASPFLKGYLEGVMEAQQKLYGISIVEGALRDNILEELHDTLYIPEEPMGVEPKGYRYANYFIKRKITQLERIKFLNMIGERFGSDYDIKLFTVDESFKVPGIKNMGVTPYETEMPFVFNDSRINLNITLRSITAGIPLRCMDILSQGGFLLSNYQADLATDFVPGEDFDFFSDENDLMEKIEYYLTHEKERAEIARNGQEKVRQYYSFEAVFGRIFETVFGNQGE